MDDNPDAGERTERKMATFRIDDANRTVAVLEQRPTGKRGRPRWYLTEDGARVVEAMSKIGCSTEEIAAAMGVRRDTLNAPHNRVLFGLARDRGLNAQKTDIRQAQARIMHAGSSQMAIFLGKNYLGQTDKTEIQVTEAPLSEMDIDELAKKLREEK